MMPVKGCYLQFLFIVDCARARLPVAVAATYTDLEAKGGEQSYARNIILSPMEGPDRTREGGDGEPRSAPFNSPSVFLVA